MANTLPQYSSSRPLQVQDRYKFKTVTSSRPLQVQDRYHSFKTSLWLAEMKGLKNFITEEDVKGTITEENITNNVFTLFTLLSSLYITFYALCL